MRVKRRKKASRYRGSHTHGRGFKKKARGSGHQGGKGMAGTGKRGDAKKTLILNMDERYFKRDKALRRGTIAPKLEAMNLEAISRHIPSLMKKGFAKEVKGVFEINLKGYKVLGEGNVHQKLVITADAASKSAIEKVKKAGGEIIIKQ
ncbi:uL15 family ribosomal protein [Candidatus Pacearchaeota archaeon]|nr:uL15 family ribosomal protein [Candidatus Pacearchaeota archaeon]